MKENNNLSNAAEPNPMVEAFGELVFADFKAICDKYGYGFTGKLTGELVASLMLTWALQTIAQVLCEEQDEANEARQRVKDMFTGDPLGTWALSHKQDKEN